MSAEPNISQRKADDLWEIAKGLYKGELYHSQGMDGDTMAMVFLPIGLGALKDFTEEEVKDIGLVYAPMKSRCSTMGIDGHPIFSTAILVHRKDIPLLNKMVQKLEKMEHMRFEDILKEEKYRRKLNEIPEVEEDTEPPG